MNSKTMTIVGAALLLFALFVPAATVSAGFLSKSMNGYETDLVFAGGAGFFLLLIGLSAKPVPGKVFSGFGVFLSIVALLVVGMVFMNLTSVSVTSPADISTGLAPVMAGLGALLALVGCATRTAGTVEAPAAVTDKATE